MHFPRILYHLFISAVAMESGSCLRPGEVITKTLQVSLQSYDFLLTLVPSILQVDQWTFFEHLEAPHTLQLMCGYNNYLNCTQKI